MHQLECYRQGSFRSAHDPTRSGAGGYSVNLGGTGMTFSTEINRLVVNTAHSVPLLGTVVPSGSQGLTKTSDYQTDGVVVPSVLAGVDAQHAVAPSARSGRQSEAGKLHEDARLG